jgi:hypothetical protein
MVVHAPSPFACETATHMPICCSHSVVVLVYLSLIQCPLSPYISCINSLRISNPNHPPTSFQNMNIDI